MECVTCVQKGNWAALIRLRESLKVTPTGGTWGLCVVNVLPQMRLRVSADRRLYIIHGTTRYIPTQLQACKRQKLTTAVKSVNVICDSGTARGNLDCPCIWGW